MRWLFYSCFIWWASGASATAVIEMFDRFEINWTNLRFRFYGESVSSDIYQESLKSAERDAWRNGIAYLQNSIGKIVIATQQTTLRDSQAGFEAAAREVSKLLVKTTSSFNTIYFADGRVRVVLENLLSRTIPVEAMRFRQREPVSYGSLEFSGIGLRLSKSVRPSARYVVIDEHGETLFDVHAMAEDAYKKNLMGRWLKRPSAAETNELIGKTPAILDSEVIAEGRFRVPRAVWDQVVEGHRALLVNGVIALLLP